MPIANSTAIATRTTSSEMMNPCSIGFAPGAAEGFEIGVQADGRKGGHHQKFADGF